MPSICRTRRSSFERSAPNHSRSRALDSATKCRDAADFDTPDPAGAGTSPSGSRTAPEFPRGDVEQHEVHRPFAKPVLPRRVLPTRQRQLMASNIAHPRPLDFHLTGLEGDLPPRAPPPIATAPFASRMAWSAGIRCVLVHHLAERCDPRGQAKAIETRGDFFEGLAHRSKDRLQNSRRQSGRSCDIRLHGVAFLSWNQHPKPTGLAVADGVADHSSALRRIDLTIEIEDRHLRREYRATITHRQDIDTGYAEGCGIGEI